ATRGRFVEAGLDDADAVLTQVLDLRFHGQASELSLPAPELIGATDVTALVDRFVELHRRAYGHVMAAPVEVVRVRSTATARTTESGTPGWSTVAAEFGTRVAVFDGSAATVTVTTRAALTDATPGPLLVDDTDTTTVVPPGWTASVDRAGNLRLERAS
ncbi:MAG TPA: hypothetical protein VH442_05490, partial [Micromonosporaceae bacterium]